ncbi:unnamed protein product, partial [Meganyctiphanes norvegica]
MDVLQITDLPWEDVVFKHIFPYLSTQEHCRLRNVSKDFLQLQCEYMNKCEKLDFSNCKMSDEVFAKITSGCEKLKWLSMANCAWISDQVLMNLLKRNLNLLHMDMSSCTRLHGGALQ